MIKIKLREMRKTGASWIKKDRVLKMLSFLITLYLTGVLANQVVQPLFTPRISEISVEPLYIQTSELNYYLVSKMNYVIEVPLFPWVPWFGSDELQLKLPYSKHFRNSAIELNTNFKEVNPYITVPLFENDSTLPFERIEETPIKVETTGIRNKELSQVFYVREKWDADKLKRHVSFSDYYWWTETTISPGLECNVKYSSREFLGYGIFDFPHNRTFRFELQNFRNDCDLKIRGFKWEVNGKDTVCIGEIQLNQLSFGESSVPYISFDLNPGEMVTVLYVYEDTDPKSYEYIKRFDYHYQGAAECFYAWNAFQNLRGSN